MPYCEKDYQKLFGVKCAYCSRFISGKVLQVRRTVVVFQGNSTGIDLIIDIFRPAIIIIFIQLAPDARNAEIRSETAKKCICKV